MSRNMECPVCGSRFHRYLPLPKAYQKAWKKYGFPHQAQDFEMLNFNAFSCPQCFSTDRDRFFALYLRNLWAAGDAGSGALLDIAPGKELSGWIRKNYTGKYVSTDLFMTEVDVKSDIQDLKEFETNSFSLVICSHVLEHVPDDVAALGSIFRVLKPGGIAILLVPILKKADRIVEEIDLKDEAERWKKFGQDDHIRLYSSQGFQDRIKMAGFALEQYRAPALKVDLAKAGIQEEALIYIAKK